MILTLFLGSFGFVFPTDNMDKHLKVSYSAYRDFSLARLRKIRTSVATFAGPSFRVLTLVFTQRRKAAKKRNRRYSRKK
jgi:hypothetical protein